MAASDIKSEPKRLKFRFLKCPCIIKIRLCIQIDATCNPKVEKKTDFANFLLFISYFLRKLRIAKKIQKFTLGLIQTLEQQKFSLTNTAIIFIGLIFTKLITTIMMTWMILGIFGFWATVKVIRDSSIAQLLQNRIGSDLYPLFFVA